MYRRAGSRPNLLSAVSCKLFSQRLSRVSSAMRAWKTIRRAVTMTVLTNGTAALLLETKKKEVLELWQQLTTPDGRLPVNPG